MEFLDGKVARKTSTLATGSNLDLRVRTWLNERGEIDAIAGRPRLLNRAELPVDTAQLARFLIGKMIVRMLAEGVAGGRIRRDRGI
jgi:hypothetical protein